MNLNIFVPIRKVDAAQRLVYGIATAEVADKSGEIMDYDSTVPYYKEWSAEFEKNTGGKSLGNIRAMHGSVAAGKVTQLVFNDAQKQIEICAKIVDDSEWKKVEEGVYTGFSQGGDYVKRWEDPVNPQFKRYTAKPCEVSIVDNPCVPTATFEYVKADGAVEMRKFKEPAKEEAKPEVTQGWQCQSDGSFHATKAAALKRAAEVEAAKAAQPAIDAMKQANDALTVKEGGEGADEIAKAAEAKKLADEKDAKKAEQDAMVIKAVKTLLSKGLYEVSRCAELIQSLQWLGECLEYEAAVEGDGSELPGDLKQMVVALCAFLKQLVDEETAELVGDDDDLLIILEAASKLSDLQKAALVPFVKNEKLLKALNDKPEPAKPDPAITDQLEKVTALNDALTKQIADLGATATDLVKRIEHLEAQPAPPKGVKTVVKGHEEQDPGSAPVEATFTPPPATSPEDAREAYKRAKAKATA